MNDRAMAVFRRFLARTLHAVRPGRAERDLAREIASHLALLEDDCRRRGMSAADARRAARLAFGGIEQARELVRDERSVRWLEDVRRDARLAFRLLRRDPIVSVTVVLSLAIGIGASAAVFSAARALLFRLPPGIATPERLVDIGVSREDGGLNPASFPAYVEVRDRTGSFTGVYARQMFPVALGLRPAGNASSAEQVFGQFVTPNYFAVLGVHPAAGTLFSPEVRDAPGASPYLVLSHQYWTARFGGDLSVVGRGVAVNGRPFTVVGIAPKGFQGTAVMACDVWLPLNMFGATTGQGDAILTSRESGWLLVGARLRPNVRLGAAAQEVSALPAHRARVESGESAARHLGVLPSSAVPGNRSTIAMFLTLLMGMVLAVVLVACANVSGVLLARASSRRREMAMRLALGAGRWRLARQLLTETAVLFVLAAAVGVALARMATPVLGATLPALPFPVALPLAFDSPVITFAVGLSLVTALVAGVGPAVQAAREQPMDALKNVHGPARARLRMLFVVAQIALSVALVVTAGLFARALAHAGAADQRVDPRDVQLASIDVSMAGYTEATGPAFWQALVERVRALAGVRQATVARVVPGGFEGIGLGLSAPGAPATSRDFEPDGNIVEPGYFATLGIALREGRDFSVADRPGATPVAIVGEMAARRFWPGERAIGKYLTRSTPEGTRRYTVVGIVADIASTTLVDGMAQSFVYLPLRQAYEPHLTSSMTLVVRTRDGTGIAPAVRQVVASLDPRLPSPTFRTLEDSIALGLVPQRVALLLSGGLGAVGLLLAAIGIYGVTASSVARRQREFAIRRALGAPSADIAGMVLRQALGLTVAGCAAGTILAAGVAGVLSAFLLGVPALDPGAFGSAIALFAAAGLAACAGPLRRANGTDPASALRCE